MDFFNEVVGVVVSDLGEVRDARGGPQGMKLGFGAFWVGVLSALGLSR